MCAAPSSTTTHVAMALSSPSGASPTARYLNEMGRLLLRDDINQERQQQSPPPPAVAIFPAQFDGDDDYDDDDDVGPHRRRRRQQFRGSRDDDPPATAFDAPSLFGEFATIAPTTTIEGGFAAESGRRMRFERPRPPPGGRRREEEPPASDDDDDDIFRFVYPPPPRPTREGGGDEPIIVTMRRSPPGGRSIFVDDATTTAKNEPPNRNLFEALNGHIEALGQRIQETFSLRNDGAAAAVDDVDDDDDDDDDDDGEHPHYPEEWPEWNHDDVPRESYFQFEEQSAPYLDDSNEAYQLYDEAPEDAGEAVERVDREREREEELMVAAREEAARAYQMAAAREEAARVADRSMPRREDGEDLERELARQKAEFYRRQVESRRHPNPSSIAKSRWVPKLPDTNDPLELLGLDRRYPPENASEIRRAFLRMAKKYHPDAVAADASPEQREKASLNFARINAAYQLLKERQERMVGGDEYFATTSGGPMHYDYRKSSNRGGGGRQSPFHGGYHHDDEDHGSVFSGHAYSARYGPAHGRQQQNQQPRTQGVNPRDRNYYGESKNPFSRKYRQEVGDNCHVSGKEFPPFFNH